MAKIVKESQHILNSGLGPVRVTQQEIADYDIDDIVAQATESQLLKLKMINIANSIDPETTIGRPPASIDGKKLGGTK